MSRKDPNSNSNKSKPYAGKLIAKRISVYSPILSILLVAMASCMQARAPTNPIVSDNSPATQYSGASHYG
ncbi:hypothetical protein SAMN04488491_0951 [Psychrobacter sp. LV10R520-6]|nr:hypothetical protein SAMN04488491_0951 [Psychrobacter sp. LV10R520-6]